MFKNKNLKIWVPWPIWAYWLSWLKRKPPPSGTNSNSHSHRTYTKWEIILPRATWSANLSGTWLPLTRHGTSAASCPALRPLRSPAVGTSKVSAIYTPIPLPEPPAPLWPHPCAPEGQQPPLMIVRGRSPCLAMRFPGHHPALLFKDGPHHHRSPWHGFQCTQLGHWDPAPSWRHLLHAREME